MTPGRAAYKALSQPVTGNSSGCRPCIRTGSSFTPCNSTWASEREPLLRPLAQVLRQQLELLTAELEPAWAAAQNPPLVAPSAGDWNRDEAMDLLWQDPSAATAAWALMVERQRGATHAERLTRQPRIDRERSAFFGGADQGPALSAGGRLRTATRMGAVQ